MKLENVTNLVSVKTVKKINFEVKLEMFAWMKAKKEL